LVRRTFGLVLYELCTLFQFKKILEIWSKLLLFQPQDFELNVIIIRFNCPVFGSGSHLLQSNLSWAKIVNLASCHFGPGDDDIPGDGSSVFIQSLSDRDGRGRHDFQLFKQLVGVWKRRWQLYLVTEKPESSLKNLLLITWQESVDAATVAKYNTHRILMSLKLQLNAER